MPASKNKATSKTNKASSKPLRAALYARVSTTDQSTEMQLVDLRAAAEARGWSIVQEYRDDGISGAQESRPALDRMLADAQAGRFDLLAVWKLDRLGRSLTGLLRILSDLGSWGVAFTSLRDPGIDTSSAAGRLLMQILACFAEYERDLIRERVVAGVRRAQAAGVHCGRPRVELDLRPALALLREGRSLHEVSEILGLSRNTLRRRLREAGEWPISTLAVETADAADAA